MRNLKAYAAHVLNTLFGMYQQKFSDDWDKDLNFLLDEGTFVEGGPHTIKIAHNGKVYGIWVSNRWYSYGHIYTVSDEGDVFKQESISRQAQRRARIRTMIRLHEYNMENNMENNIASANKQFRVKHD